MDPHRKRASYLLGHVPLYSIRSMRYTAGCNSYIQLIMFTDECALCSIISISSLSCDEIRGARTRRAHYI